MDFKLLFQIIITFAKIGIMSFGGGYAAIPLIERQVVTVNGWMTYQEFADIITLDELTPGPIAINAATFVGTKMAGVPGAICATFGNVLPSCIIVLILAFFYYKYRSLKVIDGALNGLRSMVVALISSTALTMLTTAVFNAKPLDIEISNFNIYSFLIFGIGLFIMRKFKTSPLIMMLICGIIGLCIFPFV